MNCFSSLQNIFFRVAVHHNFNLILNTNGYAVTPAEAAQPPWHSFLISKDLYNLMTLHTHWNHEFVSGSLGPKATYISVVRNPVDAFESLYSYSNFEERLGMTLETFAVR